MYHSTDTQDATVPNVFVSGTRGDGLGTSSGVFHAAHDAPTAAGSMTGARVRSTDIRVGATVGNWIAEE